MNRKEAAELFPIIKAFSEGKVIQTSIKGKTWEDLGEDIEFYLNDKYRIKSESKYRPFANTEECRTEMEKHQPFWLVKDRNGSKFLIENVDSRDFVDVYGEGTCNFCEVFDNHTFADGSPFGVKLEE